MRLFVRFCSFSRLKLAGLFAVAIWAASSYAQVTLAHLASRDLGWAVVNSHIFMTTDEGLTWRDITPSLPKAESLSGLQFLDSNVGFLSSVSHPDGDLFGLQADIAIRKTIDGGHNWLSTKITSASISKSGSCCFGASIYFVDSLHGWLMARLVSGSNFDIGSLFSTTDGGKTWVSLPNPPLGSSPYFVTTDLGWLTGGPAGDAFWRTRDGGRTWQEIAISGVANDCAKACRPSFEEPLFVDPLHGQVAVTLIKADSSEPQQYRTADGGTTWTRMTEPSVAQTTDDSHRVVFTSSGSMSLKMESGGTISLALQGNVQRAKLPVKVPLDAGTEEVVPAGFINQSEGWIVHSGRHCDQDPFGHRPLCVVGSELLITHDGGKSFEIVTPVAASSTGDTERSPPNRLLLNSDGTDSVVRSNQVSMVLPAQSTTTASAAPANPPATPGPIPSLYQLSLGNQGFDVACAPSASLMSTWWNFSPFYDLGVYLGGYWATCGTTGPGVKGPQFNINLTSVWAQNASNTGWGILPIWVGYQAPSNCGTAFSSNIINGTSTSAAYSQGVSDAQQAISAASAFEINGVIYTDVEHYNVSPCPAVQSYLQGWGNTLHAGQYDAGVYMSYSNKADYTSGSLAGYIDAAWVAKYDEIPNNSTVATASPFWLSHQYCADPPPVSSTPCGTTPETFGGASITGNGAVDEDFDATIVSSFYAPRNLADTLTLTSPIDLQIGVSTQPTLLWLAGLPAAVTDYFVEIATTPTNLDFSYSDKQCVSCTYDDQTTAFSLTVPPNANLAPGTTYFWQVRPDGQYKYGNWSPTFAFTTACAASAQVHFVQPPPSSGLRAGTKMPVAVGNGCTNMPTPPAVCQPLSQPPYPAPEGDTWVWDVATCQWVLETSGSASACSPGNSQPPYPAPQGSTWVWDTYTCSWILTSPTQPCNSPTFAPPSTVLPSGEVWQWNNSSNVCAWVPVSPPTSGPPVCTGPTSQPPSAPPEGETWNWDNTNCTWELVPIPYTNPPPPCVPGSSPDGPPVLGYYYVWLGCSWVEEPDPGSINQGYDPIVIDTDGSGFHLTSPAAGVKFDFYGTGSPTQIAWTNAASTNGWLALDRNGNGTIDNGSELFGNLTPQPGVPGTQPNGYLALAVFDTAAAGGNGDGIIDKHDQIWPQLLVWIDANHDGISQPSELHHLDDIGIHSIHLKYKNSWYLDQYANMFRFKGRLNPVAPDTVDRVIFDVFLQTVPQ